LKSAVTALVPNKWPMNITSGVIAVIPSGKPSGVPKAFDCAVRQLAYDYARQVRPDKESFVTAFDALQLDTCNVSRPSQKTWCAPPWGITVDATTPEYFVSAERGDDAASGTIETPFATPHRGLNACRAAKSSSCMVTLRRGTYYLDSPLLIGPDNSGLTLRSYTGERAELSGGVPLTGLQWKPANATGRAGTAAVFAAPFHSSKGAIHSMRLRGSGRRVTRARYTAINASSNDCRIIRTHTPINASSNDCRIIRTQPARYCTACGHL
jgi:hypothetical protein